MLGAVILHEDGDGGRLDVVDGQQRLLTLRMILGILDGQTSSAPPRSARTPSPVFGQPSAGGSDSWNHLMHTTSRRSSGIGASSSAS